MGIWQHASHPPQGVSQRVLRPSVTNDPTATMVPLDTQTLRELLIAARSSDGPATDALLARVRLLALRYARARLGRFGVEDVAQDVAQEVCLAVYSALATYDDRGLPFEAFVYSITARKVADAQRSLMRAPAPVAELPEGEDPGRTPEEEAVLSDDVSRAFGLLDRLPATQREILLLRVAMGWKTDETAAALEMTPGAVRVAQHRAIMSLRAMLAGAEGGHS